MVCLKKMFYAGEKIFHLKRIYTEKVVFLQVKERIDTDYCQVPVWKTFVHVSIMHEISFWWVQNIVHETISYVHLKMEKLISVTRFGSRFLEKSITKCTFLDCVSRMYQKS